MNSHFRIGVDEVGRGPLYGSVYAAAVLQTEAIETHPDIKDSKKFTSDAKRRRVNDFIQTHETSYYAIASRSAAEIDRVNILQASQMAMHDAIRELINRLLIETPTATFHILVDGNYFVPYIHDPARPISVTWECIVGGDGISKTIAAASIIAKVARDASIEVDCETNPELNRYDLCKNKGYGTKRHIAAIREFGPAPGHRMQFQPLKSMYLKSTPEL